MNELNELMTRESGPVVRLLEKLERTLAEVGRLRTTAPCWAENAT